MHTPGDNRIPSIEEQLQRLQEIEARLAETVVEISRIRNAIAQIKKQKGEENPPNQANIYTQMPHSNP